MAQFDRERTTRTPLVMTTEPIKVLRYDGSAEGLSYIANHLDGKYAVAFGEERNRDEDSEYAGLPGLRFIAIPTNPALTQADLEMHYPLDGIVLAAGHYLVQAKPGALGIQVTPDVWHPWGEMTVEQLLKAVR